MPDLLRSWAIGPGRPCPRYSLPLPGHRNMGEVMRAEKLEAIRQGTVDLAHYRATKRKPSGIVGCDNMTVAPGNERD